ncbi:MAG: addiction module protein [Candidatus Latescibacterota bacterium]
MHKDLRELIEKAKGLSDLDKLALIDELLAQLDRPDPEIDRIWAEEAEKRLKMYREGKLETVSFEEIMEKYRR